MTPQRFRRGRLLSMSIALLLCTSLRFASASPSSAPAPAPTAVETRIDSIFAHFGTTTPGCAVGVYRAGEVVFAKGYGMANLEHGVAITPETPLDIGSNSKQFTAFAIQLLARRGQLSLDDDVLKHVPELPDLGTRTTLRHLINNTSGLRDFAALRWLEDPRWSIEHPITRAEAMDLLARQRAVSFVSGERYLYSNTNWILLALVVERVSGRSFHAFLEQEVFTPLGMNRTVLRDDPMLLVPGRATNYTPLQGGGYRGNVAWALTRDLPGPGYIHTTVEDLSRWDANFYDERVGAAGITEAMYTRGRLAAGDTIAYASGLIVGEHLGRRAVFHGGAGGGASEIIRFPEERLTVAVLCNQYSSYTPADLYARQVSELYLPDRATAGPDLRGPAPDEAELARFAGRYLILESGRFSEYVVHDGILAQRSGERLWPLVALGNGRFEDHEVRIDFTPDAQAGTLHLADGSKLPLQRADAEWHPAAAELAPYEGVYHSDELDVSWSVRRVEDALVLRRHGAADTTLQPLLPDRFRAPSLMVTFLRGADGVVRGLSLNAARALNVEFTRVSGR
jgi:CubicO group peptidase (beta-lactamase class C family)